jgi:hypothetical protein
LPTFGSFGHELQFGGVLQPRIGPVLPLSNVSLPVALPVRPGHDLEAFLAFIPSLSGRLASATGSAVDREVEAGLRELLTFVGVEQCGTRAE